MFVLCVCLGGCRENPPAEGKIIDDIPENFINLRVNKEEQKMEIADLDIIKRQTNEKDDNVYCVITMDCDDYELVANCYLQYNYYNQGGWILDYAEVQDDLLLIPLTCIPEEQPEEEIKKYYGNYNLINHNFSKEEGMDIYEYYVFDDYENCSFSGVVDVKYIFYYSVENDDGLYRVNASWQKRVTEAENFSCQWYVEGTWYAKTPSYKYELYLGILSTYNNEVDIEATNFYDGDPYNWYTGQLEYYDGSVDMKCDYSEHGEPTMSFSFRMEAAAGIPVFKVEFYKDCATMQMDGRPIAELIKLN